MSWCLYNTTPLKGLEERTNTSMSSQLILSKDLHWPVVAIKVVVVVVVVETAAIEAIGTM